MGTEEYVAYVWAVDGNADQCQFGHCKIVHDGVDMMVSRDCSRTYNDPLPFISKALAKATEVLAQALVGGEVTVPEVSGDRVEIYNCAPATAYEALLIARDAVMQARIDFNLR